MNVVLLAGHGLPWVLEEMQENHPKGETPAFLYVSVHITASMVLSQV